MVTLNQYLEHRHIQAGLNLEWDEDALILTQNKEPKAYFHFEGASTEAILKEADKLLEEESKC
jgi:hypothetical protein